VVVLELSPVMLRAIERRGALPDERYPHRVFRRWQQGRVSACALLSRWPASRVEPTGGEIIEEHALLALIEHRAGRFLAGGMHPPSPRTPGRWTMGNLITVAQAELAAEASGPAPLVLGADLNATPAQKRARIMREHGLRMAKPLTRVGGGFPSDGRVPEALRLHLDDVWRSGDIRPVAWSRLPVAGSDHDAVVVDFVVGSE